MTYSFRDRSVVITGAASGLGRTLALDLAQSQAQLVLADQDAEALSEIEEQAASLGARVLAQPTDVTSEEQCRDLIWQAVQQFSKIDFLILCAGISMWTSFEEVTSLSLFRKLMDVNFMGIVHCVHPALPYLKESRGTIVTISSTQGVIGLPNHTAYSASKHALNGFLEALEFETGEAIRILNVMPGWIRGTNLRQNALKGDGSRAGPGRRHSAESVSVEESSQAILKALRKGQRELYLPAKLRFIPWVKLLAPGWLRTKIRRAVEDQDVEP